MTLVREAWNEPAPPDPPGRGRWDWALAVVLSAFLTVEAIARWGTPSWPLAVAGSAVLIPTLLWRRTHPLPMLAIAYGVGAAATALHLPDVYTSVFVLLLPYAVVRWGSGRAVILGVAMTVGQLVLTIGLGGLTWADAIGGLAVLAAAVGLGLAVRYRAGAKVRELDRARAVERERLARDLHDTVAHHVSAIAVRAQAGLAVAQSRPEAAEQALRVIEAEAKRALAEMRSIVRVLRHEDPQPGIGDLASLADGTGPAVDIQVIGALDTLAPSVQTAVFHLARESVTNARRHARGATRIDVRVRVDGDAVLLTVADDGVAAAAYPDGGFGLVGMAERAGLVGGECRAGPNPERGWTVTAVLPRQGAMA
ncbi:MAG: sensor histidine kinase [Hamadaea sp.]|nr:sensor histidine kinase [Hamadaea sp.]